MVEDSNLVITKDVITMCKEKEQIEYPAGIKWTKQRKDVYEVILQAHEPLSALKTFYLATLGGAKALHLDKVIGNFEKGKEADFIVLDVASSELLEFRLEQCKTLEERLFVIQMLANDRIVEQTYILGQPVL